MRKPKPEGMSESRSGWFNYVKNEYEYIETPTDFSNYVPQLGGRGLYQIYVNHEGMQPIAAALKVLQLSLGEGREREVSQ